MITICAVEKDEEEEIIRNVTKEFFPESLFITARGGCETGQKISVNHPEIVWLEATPDNYDMISSLENTGGINFILVSDDIEKAFDAVLLRASGFICRPVTEKAVSEELRRLRYPLPCMNSLKVQCFGNFEVFFRGKIVKSHEAAARKLLHTWWTEGEPAAACANCAQSCGKTGRSMTVLNHSAA